MILITARKEVLNVYSEAAQKNWVIPCFCSENLTTTETILAATKEYGDKIAVSNLPVSFTDERRKIPAMQSFNNK